MFSHHSSGNLTKKHKKLQDGMSTINNSSSAMPYRVQRYTQPTQHRQFQVITESKNAGGSEEDDDDDSWI